MAATTVYKVYAANGEYVASTKYLEDAACLVAMRGDGTQVKYQHRATLWTEGKEETSADESYDTAAAVMWQRVQEYLQERAARLTAR